MNAPGIVAPLPVRLNDVGLLNTGARFSSTFTATVPGVDAAPLLSVARTDSVTFCAVVTDGRYFSVLPLIDASPFAGDREKVIASPSGSVDVRL